MRKMHPCIITFLSVIFVFHIARAQSSTYETYQATDFSIEYPTGWKVDETGTMGARVFFFSPLESAGDKFSENINIITQDLSEHPMTLREYTELSLKQIKTLANNSKLIESKTIHTAIGEAQKLIYTADQGQFHLKFEQLYFIIKNQSYTANGINFRMLIIQIFSQKTIFYTAGAENCIPCASAPRR